MQFTNNRSQYIQNTNNNNNLNLIRARSNITINKPVPIHSTPPPPPPTPTTTIKKMRWGEPTWFLFHTLAHKIKDEHFTQIRIELLNTIATICNNLPCPTCTEHASAYIKRVPFYSIQSKQGLKDFLFKFHNEVNKQKGFTQYSYNDLDSKYEYANTSNIIHNFIFYFQDKSHSIRMIANDMFRMRISNQLKQWFNANIQYFNQ